MYPVVLGNGRSLQSDTVISGYHVPKGVCVGKCKFEVNFNNIFHNLADPRHFSTLRLVECRRILS